VIPGAELAFRGSALGSASLFRFAHHCPRPPKSFSTVLFRFTLGYAALAPLAVTPGLAVRAGSVSISTSAPVAAKVGHVDGKAMTCMQCEQTDQGKGCHVVGVCGKTPEVANLQVSMTAAACGHLGADDLQISFSLSTHPSYRLPSLQDCLVHSLKSMAMMAHACRQLGIKYDKEVDHHLLSATFSTLTNVNFDADDFVNHFIPSTLTYRNQLAKLLKEEPTGKGFAALQGMPKETAEWDPLAKKGGFFSNLLGSEYKKTALEQAGISVGVAERKAVVGEEVLCLHELITYGIKGTCAYAEHAL
jgi:hydroxylamine reductase